MENSSICQPAEIKTQKGISGFSLHLFAMATMLIDHIGFSFPNAIWLRAIGRLAFPVFAFLIVEGYCHTANKAKYAIRLFAFGLISEIPFDLYFFNGPAYLLHQNVMWTFLISLLVIWGIDYLKGKCHWAWGMFLTVAIGGLGCYVGEVAMADYSGAGVLTVIVFYLFREPNMYNKICQLLSMIFINFYMLGGWSIEIPVFGYTIAIPLQGFAVFSLMAIWMYKGRHGYYNKAVKYIYYGFYPVHLIILFFLRGGGVL